MNAHERQLKHENDTLKRTLAALRLEHATAATNIARLSKSQAALSLRLAAVDVPAAFSRFAETARDTLAAAVEAYKQTTVQDEALVATLTEALDAEKARCALLVETDALRSRSHERNLDELARARKRQELAEDREAALFARLVKRLPADWRGRSVRDIAQSPTGAQALNVLLVDVLAWLTEQASRKTEPTAPAPKKQPSGAQKRKAAAAKAAAQGGA